MEIENISNPIASRKLIAGDGAVFVVIGKPQPFEDGVDFYCPYSIEYGTQRKFSYAGGTDSVQALQLALKKIGVDLLALGKKKGIEISWLSDTAGDTGFPV